MPATSAPRPPFKAPFRSRASQTGDRPKFKSPKKETKTLFQKYFKSVGPRTYAAQLKEAGNGNHFLVLTEGKRDPKTDDLKKCSLFIFSEDFEQFKGLLRDTFKFISEHPLPAEVRQKREKFWKQQSNSLPKLPPNKSAAVQRESVKTAAAV